ncbi:MAG TPA: DNA-directed RNA polymerase subunit alpha C-terminal domain-containing protein [Anaerolineales bacterium]
MEAREAARTSLDRPIGELGLETRAIDALAKGGITTTGQALDRLGQGDAAVLALEGFGRKSLADLKKKLRGLGYELPEATGEITV